MALAFTKLHDDIVKIIMSPVNLSSYFIKPTTPLTPFSSSISSIVATSTTYSHFPIDSISPTPPPSPFTPPARVCPLAPLPPLISQVPTNPLSFQPPSLANNKALNKQLATKSISSTSTKTCKFYMQGH